MNLNKDRCIPFLKVLTNITHFKSKNEEKDFLFFVFNAKHGKIIIFRLKQKTGKISFFVLKEKTFSSFVVLTQKRFLFYVVSKQIFFFVFDPF